MEPEAPTEPEAPAEPEAPKEPEAPTEPEAPKEPEAPAEPEAPKEPETACGHPKTEKFEPIPGTEREYAPVEGEKKHSYQAKYRTIELCESCQTRVVVEAQSEGYRQFVAPHRYARVEGTDEYRCVCKAVCGHGGSVVGECYEDDHTYTDNGDGTVIHEWSVYCDVKCPDCGRVEKQLVESGCSQVEGTAVEDGTVEDGTVEDAAVEDAAAEDGTVEDGTVEDGAVEDAAAEDGIVEDGTVEDAAVEDGTVEDAAAEDGTVDAAAEDAAMQAMAFGLFAAGEREACAHEQTESCFTRRNYRVGEPVGSGEHKVYWDVYIEYTCKSCGESWVSEEPVKTGVEGTDTCHDAGSGKCACGADYQACTHPNKTAQTELIRKEVISSDEYGHTCLVDIYSYEHCSDCYITVGEGTLVQENATVTDGHIYNSSAGGDAVCSVCGYALTCTHQNTNTVYGEMIVHEVVSRDERQHTVLCDREIWTYCNDCYWTLRRWIEQNAELTEDHSYDENGVCRHCGYENTCQHERKRKKTYYVDSYNVQYVDEMTHSFCADEWAYWYCPDCHYSFGNEHVAQNVFVTERHDFDDNGVCDTCHRRSTCTHEDAQSWFNQKNTRVTKKNGDGTHEIMYDMYVYHQCDRCGMNWRDAEPAWKDLTLVEDCYNEEGDLCLRCGMPIPSKTCPHTNTFTDVVDSDDKKVLSFDGTFHTYQADVIELTVCSDCYAEVGRRVIQEKATFKARHDDWYFEETDTGRVCALCGYEIPACGHEHATTELDRKWNLPVTKVLGSTEDEHTVICDALEIVYCPDCYTELSTKALRDVELTEPHEYDENGKCTICGYTDTCKHESTKKETYYGLIRNLEMDERFHRFYADEWERTVCQDCGQWLGNRLVQANQYVIDSHKYGGDGVCTVCGYRTADCTHKAAVSTMAEGNQRITPNGNGTHTVTFDMYVRYTCPDCGFSWSPDEPLYTDLTCVEHCNFDSTGVCRVCGAKESEIVCKHPNLEHVRDIDYGTIKLIASDQVKHVLQADVVSYDTCPDCWAELNYTLVQKDALFNESHEPYLAYDDTGAECLRCGYMVYEPSTCKHEKVSKSVLIRAGLEPKGYADITARTHAAIYDAEEEEMCELCYKVFSRRVVLDTKLVEEHTYGKDGVCTACGYKNTCAHKNAGTEREFDLIHDARVESGDRHSFAADLWERWSCPDCGAHSEWSLIAGNQRFEEAHSFSAAGVCTFCGTQKLAPTPVPAPTPRPTSERTSAPVVTATPVPAKQDVVSAMLEAVDDALLESQAADVAVIGVQEIVTAAEYSRLRALPLREQMLVTLSAIGLDDMLTDTVSTLRIKVSDDAQSLMDDIAARLGTMTAQERAEFNALLEAYFPVTERVSGGVTVRCFTIELQVVVSDFARVERYQFYLDADGRWILERVDLTAFGRVG